MMSSFTKFMKRSAVGHLWTLWAFPTIFSRCFVRGSQVTYRLGYWKSCAQWVLIQTTVNESYHFTNKQTKTRQTLSNRKFMATVFWKVKGVFGRRVCGTQNGRQFISVVRLRRAIQNKLPWLSDFRFPVYPWLRVILIRHSKQTIDCIKIKWDVFDHPRYNPYLDPSEFYLFIQKNKWLGSQLWGYDEDFEISWVKSEAEEWISKQVHCYDR